jgi:hypothetical protein
MSQSLEMLVRNGPGMIALTRTFGPRASASPTVITLTPALAAAYGTMSPVGRTAPVLLTLMIEPPSLAAIRSPTKADSRNGPFRLTANTLSHSSSETSESRP